MKKKSLLMAAVAFGAMLPLAAMGQNLVKNGDAEAGEEGWTGAKVCAEGPQSGKASFEFSTKSFAVTNDFIAVDGSKNYVVSASFKNLDTTNVGTVFLSFIPHDADKKPIESFMVNVYPPAGGHETVLTAPCAPGDTVIKIKDGSKWQAYPHACVAFNIDDSGAMSDLPNRDVSSGFGIKSVENKGDHWAVTLATPCGKTFAAGTKVREHAAGATFMYPAIISNLSPADGWKKVEAKIEGTAKAGTGGDKFWNKTAFIKVRVFAIDSAAEPKRILFDDLKLEEAK